MAPLRRSRKTARSFDEARDGLRAGAVAQVGEDVRALPAHALGIRVHHREVGPDEGREVDLVDDEEVGSGDPRAPLAGDLLASGNVDDVDREVGEFWREGGGEVVAAGLDQDEIELRETTAHVADGREIDRGVLADRRVGAAPCLDADDALLGQGPGHREEARVLLGVDVVRDGAEVVAVAEGPAQGFHEGGLAGPHGAADTNPKWAVRGTRHDRNSLVYWVSCRNEPRSARNVAPPMWSSVSSGTAAASAATAGASPATTRVPPVCPMGASRTAAETRFWTRASRYPSTVGSSGTPWAADEAPTATGYATSPGSAAARSASAGAGQAASVASRKL